MKILVIGSGGREHALIWKLAQSPRVEKLFCAPGNAGIFGMAECIPLQVMEFPDLLSFAKKQNIDMTVVGPEAPLTEGIVDRFEKEGLKIFGPSRDAARIEGSKVFAKRFMEKYSIPTAPFQVFDSAAPAKEYIRRQGAPLVVKADGLAAGKGVIVSQTEKMAIQAVEWIMEEKAFGDAGSRVVIEECLQGEEASFMAFTDGTTVIPMVSAQDHKRLRDGDTGPNTGGMGAYSPAPVITEALTRKILREVMIPAIQGFSAEGIVYRGILYAGLMMTSQGPRVLEFNCRFGDPEAQAVLTRLDTDLLDILESTLSGSLSGFSIRWSSKPSVCVVLSSGGYPEKAESGKVISGVPQAEQEAGVTVFHSATLMKDGKLLTDGGRVLGVTAVGDDLEEAIRRAYRATGHIRFDGMQYRKDIGARALGR